MCAQPSIYSGLCMSTGKKSFKKAPLASPASLYALNSEFSSSHESERKNTRCAYLPSFSQNTELKVWMLL